MKTEAPIARIQITEKNAPNFSRSDDEIANSRGGAMRLTRGACYAAGDDAGNRRMRKAGRKTWDREDYRVAAEQNMRLQVLGGFLPKEIYEFHCGQPFPA